MSLGLAMRSDEEYVERKVMRVDVEGTRSIRKPKRRWLDSGCVLLRQKLFDAETQHGLCGRDLADTATPYTTGKICRGRM